MSPSCRTTHHKKKPVEPDWHKRLRPVAQRAGSYKPIGDPDVIEFKNLCKRYKSFGLLTDWSVQLMSGDKVYAVYWVARDTQWSGKA